MWPLKEKENRQLLVAKSYPLWQAVRMRRYSSLINIYPSDEAKLIHQNSKYAG